MYISLNWIKDYVNLDGIDPKKLINQFTLSCAEVEGVEEKGKNVSGVITAKIIKVNAHPNSKKLHLLKVDTGKGLIDIVCGAPNVREGLIVPLAEIGANVNGLKIEKAVVGGFESFGMCCSAKELGFSDDHSGLFEFPEETKIGEDIKNILDIDDVIFEVDNKSLTNRPDMWGIYGIARECAALLKKPLEELPVYKGNPNKTVPNINIKTEKCFRYSSATMENITKKVSPINMQIRLYYCGMRGINLLTDITNYIMLELGQPMHAFDNDLVKSIEVDVLKEPANFITLDENVRELPENTMVIKSNNEPVAIAGVMGGLKSCINDSTNKVLIESASFDAYTVRTTAIKLGMRTESSARYEKSLDPEMTMIALRRYIYLMQQIDQGASISSGIADIYKYKYPKIEIEITKKYIDNYIGISIPEKDIIATLTNLQFDVLSSKPGEYKVIVPSFRATKDITCKADLVEEIARIYGYDNIKPQSIKQPVTPVKLSREIDLEYNVKYALASKFDLSEIHSYIWYDSDANKELGIEPDSKIRIINALQKDNDKIRATMIPSILKACIVNRNLNKFGIFEIGRVVKSLRTNNNVDETKNLCIALYDKGNREEMLIKMKDTILYIFENIIKAKVTIRKGTPTEKYLSPANYYEVYSNNVNLGYIASIYPTIEMKIDSKANIVVSELDFSKILVLPEESYKFKKVSKYQKSVLDFTFVIDDEILYENLQKIGQIKTNLCYNLLLSDIYETDKLRSYTITYEIWSEDHTLSGNEIENFHKSIIDTFAEKNIKLKE